MFYIKKTGWRVYPSIRYRSVIPCPAIFSYLSGGIRKSMGFHFFD